MTARSSLLLFLALFLLVPAGTAAQDPPVVIRGGQMFTGLSDSLEPNRGIVLHGGKLLVLDERQTRLDLSGAQVVELGADEVILPGFVDVHAHYNVNLMGTPRTEELQVMPVLYLANGATTTFPNGEYNPWGMRDLRLRIEAGLQVGPRIINSGPYFGSSRPGWSNDITPDSIRQEVDFWVAQGAGAFKAKGPQPQHLRALIERAHLHGLTVTGHLDSGFRNSVNPRDAVLWGIDRVEHFLGGDHFPDTRSAYASFPEQDVNSPEFREIVELFVTHGAVYDATLTAYGYFSDLSDDVFELWTDESRFFTPEVRASFEEFPPHQYMDQFQSIYETKCPEVRAFHEMGGTLSLGTDHVSTGMFLAPFGVHREMHALNRCGVPNADVLRIATINGARTLGVGDRVGTIEAGKLADLVIIQGNPLDEIRNTRNVRLVIKNGEIYDPEALFQSVEGRLAPMARDARLPVRE